MAGKQNTRVSFFYEIEPFYYWLQRFIKMSYTSKISICIAMIYAYSGFVWFFAFRALALGIAKIAEGTSNIASLQLGDPTLIKKRNILHALKGHGTDDQNKEAENYFKDGGTRNLKEFKYTRPEKIKVQIEKYIDTRTYMRQTYWQQNTYQMCYPQT